MSAQTNFLLEISLVGYFLQIHVLIENSGMHHLGMLEFGTMILNQYLGHVSHRDEDEKFSCFVGRYFMSHQSF